MTKPTIDVKVGSVWIENDKRFQDRYLLVIELLNKPVPGANATVPAARITPCTPNGVRLSMSLSTVARISRFGKAGGYKLVKDAS